MKTSRKKLLMRLSIMACAFVVFSGGYFMYQLNEKDMKIRNACYSIGIKYMPPSTDQSLIQGSKQYQDCIDQGWKN